MSKLIVSGKAAASREVLLYLASAALSASCIFIADAVRESLVQNYVSVFEPVFLTSALLVIVMTVTKAMLRVYSGGAGRRFAHFSQSFILSYIVALSLCLLLYYVLPFFRVPITFLFLYLAIDFSLNAILVMGFLLSRKARAEIVPVFGEQNTIEELHEMSVRFEIGRRYQYVPVSLEQFRSAEAAEIKFMDVDEVIIEDAFQSEIGPNSLMQFLSNHVSIHSLESFVETNFGIVSLKRETSESVIVAYSRINSLGRSAVKRLFDVAVSAVLLLALSPIMILAAILIYATDRGPVLYRQTRVGLLAKEFGILKFRSMIQAAEADGKAQWAQKGDARVTRIGRIIRLLRIDELPQLLNILWGDMSFVGPRPERPEFVSKLKEEIPLYDLRHLVKPGLTGWAQVRYPYGASVEDARAKLAHDLFYVKYNTLLLDLVVAFLTPRIVILASGAR